MIKLKITAVSFFFLKFTRKGPKGYVLYGYVNLNILTLYGFIFAPVMEIVNNKDIAHEKNNIKSRMKDGSIQLIVGTHALIQDDVVGATLSAG